MIASHGYGTAPFGRTFDCYDYVDCYNYMDLHDVLKLAKHGYSKVTDHASREIRHGRLTRDQGLALVRKHEQAPLQRLDLFCAWLNVNPRGLQSIIDHHRSRRFWHEHKPGEFEFACLIPGHRESGMTGTLTVK